ncbi:hypothetical protein BH10CYA1_BH10CYA1_32280 [soil metagenome]
MSEITIILFVLLGLLAGSLSGLLGIGGGVILVPSLVLVFGYSQHMAQGTTLVLMIPPIGLLAAWNYYKKGGVDLRIAALLCFGFAFGGLVGARLSGLISGATLSHVFAVTLILIAVKMLFGCRNNKDDADATERYPLNCKNGCVLVVVGLSAGIISGLLGIGGGIIIVPALVFLFGLPQRVAQGTTVMLMVPPIGLLAAREYFQQGNVDLAAGGLICAGFFIGAFFGSKLATAVPTYALSKVFGIAMLLIACKTW